MALSVGRPNGFPDPNATAIPPATSASRRRSSSLLGTRGDANSSAFPDSGHCEIV